MVAKETDTENVEYDAAVKANVAQARKDFESCHYYTHSPWYAAILFYNDRVLMHDGLTDGGCTLLTPIPATDVIAQCPGAYTVEADCAPVPDNSQPMPVVEMTTIVVSLLSAMFLGGVIGYAAVIHFRNDMWIFGYDKKEGAKHKEGFLAFLLGKIGLGKELKTKKKKKKGVDRARAARDRKKQGRLDKHDRQTNGGNKKSRRKSDGTEVDGEVGEEIDGENEEPEEPLIEDFDVAGADAHDDQLTPEEKAELESAKAKAMAHLRKSRHTHRAGWIDPELVKARLTIKHAHDHDHEEVKSDSGSEYNGA